MNHDTNTIAIIENADVVRDILLQAVVPSKFHVQFISATSPVGPQLDSDAIASLWVGISSLGNDPVAALAELRRIAPSLPIVAYCTEPCPEDTLIGLFGMKLEDVIAKPLSERLLAAKARAFAERLRRRMDQRHAQRLSSLESENRFRIMADQSLARPRDVVLNPA